MAATTEVTFRGLGKVFNDMGDATRGLDFMKPLKVSKILIIASTKENFAGGHTPDGQSWPPLRMPRVRSKGKDQPLRDRGLLMASITGTGVGHVERLTDTSLEIGTNLEYAAIQNNGGVIRPKKAKALAIPLTLEALRAQSPRNFPRTLSVIWPKGHTSGTLSETKTVGRKKEAVRINHYLLVSKVTIPPRQFLGLNEKTIDKIEQAFADHAAETMLEGKRRAG